MPPGRRDAVPASSGEAVASTTVRDVEPDDSGAATAERVDGRRHRRRGLARPEPRAGARRASRAGAASAASCTNAADAALLEVIDPRIEVVVGDVRDPAVIDELFDGVERRVGVPRRRGDPSRAAGARAVRRERRAARSSCSTAPGASARRGSCTSRRTRRSARTRTSDGSLRRGLAVHARTWRYGRSKLEAEQLVQRSYDRGDLATVDLRPPWFYGPFQPERQTQFLAAVRKGRFPLVGPGTQRRSMVYTGNLVQGVLLAEVADAAPGPRVLDRRRRAVRAARRAAHRARRARGRGALACRTAARSPIPRVAGVVAEKLDARRAGERSLRAGPARARRVDAVPYRTVN